LIASLTMVPLLWPAYWTQGLQVALGGSALLGTLYSLEPFRLKRFPLLAAFCIVAVRGTIINASFYAHAKAVAFTTGTTAAAAASSSTTGVLHCLLNDPACFWSSFFFCVFGMVIAVMKDVPDVAGDRQADVKTFSVRLGQTRIFHVGRRLLTTLFVGFGAAFVRQAWLVQGVNLPLTIVRGLTATACLAAAQSVRATAKPVDPTDSQQVYGYYMHLWKLFYLCYLTLPFAR
jgi:homogentisate phytyltransferase/homogentisate geranylgeranyltransferase